VPILGFNGHVIAFNSMYGGKSWTKAVNVATYISHADGGRPAERRPDLVGG